MIGSLASFSKWCARVLAIMQLFPGDLLGWLVLSKKAYAYTNSDAEEFQKEKR